MNAGRGPRHPDAQELAAWQALLAIHARVIARLDAELRERHQLPLDWYDVLYQLDVAGGHRTMGELARALLIGAPSSCTRLVDRLEAAGLVERETDPDDARVRHAVLTAAGRTTLRRAAPTHLAGIRRWFSDLLGPGDATGLTTLHERLTVQLGLPLDG